MRDIFLFGRRQQLLDLIGVGEIAVVGQRQSATTDLPEGGLSVLPHRRTGGRIAVMPDGQMPGQRTQRGLVEDLTDQAHVLEDHDAFAIGHSDAGGLLAAVL
ncbi:hypothetical protein SDC9_168114 [bioreactor metagenome]|uniref:Uncharacterized protein n=1 Tax=bioreactor metagenome TaxID=1076179 RepID=A0A645G278_9ZZZZ